MEKNKKNHVYQSIFCWNKCLEDVMFRFIDVELLM
jgi:hypothetical protein